MVQDGPRIGSLRAAQVMDALVPWEISSPSNPVGGPWKHWLLVGSGEHPAAVGSSEAE